MKIGAITNSWGKQISMGNLSDLIRDVRLRGAAHVELRQTFLGDCEIVTESGWHPVIPNLQSLAQNHVGLSFNIALAGPFLSDNHDPVRMLFMDGLAAAKAVGGEEPHLRVVDPAAGINSCRGQYVFKDMVRLVTELAKIAASEGVIFSIENSYHSIGELVTLVAECRRDLPTADGQFLGLCIDPINQLRRRPEVDSLMDLESVPVDMVKIVHFKQLRNGRPFHVVGSGDLDIGKMIGILKDKNYDGIGICEIPSHIFAFENFSTSVSYLSKMEEETQISTTCI